MARLDYSRFNGLGDSDSEEESTPAEQASDLLAELPSDLPKGLSLVLAARQGQQHLVDALLSSRVEVDSRDPHGGTALLRAVQLGIAARPTIQRLLEASAEVGALSDFGETPLSEAASSGSVELLQSLLDASRLVPPPSLLGAALAKAAEAKQRGTTRLLLEQKAPPLLEALFGWIDCGDLEMMTALLERKASVNERREHDGETALVAASASRPEVVLLLCQWKAEVNAVNRKGVAPLVAACSASREAVVEALLNCRAAPDVPEASMSPLVAAALAGNCAVAQRLLAASATAEAVDAQGRTALAAAAATGSGQLCHLLLAARCDPNCAGGAAGAAGAPPLAIAVAAQHTALAVQLLAARADVEQLNERKQSPLMMAAAAGNLEMCRKLLEAGASPNAVDAEDAKSPLVLSASVGHREICQVLLEAKALVNSGTVTALHAAAANGHEEVCRDLLSARANLSALGPQQRTAAQAAQRAGYAALSELLSSP